MSVLVTGVDTTLGYNIARALASDGFGVRVLVPGKVEPEHESAGIEAFEGETSDPESCLASLSGIRAVFHCESGRLFGAGPIGTRGFIEGTRNLLVAMSRLGVEDLVYAGSALTFAPGGHDDPGDESAAWGNPLGLSCLDALQAAGDLAQRYNDSGKVRCVTVSPTLVIGNGEMPGGPGWWLLGQVASGENLKPAGSVNVVRAADAAEACVKALGRSGAGQSFILGGVNVLNSVLVESIASELGSAMEQSRARSRAGRVLDLASRLVPRVRAPEPEIMKVAGVPLCYNPARAIDRLDLRLTPLADTVREAVKWYLSRVD